MRLARFGLALTLGVLASSADLGAQQAASRSAAGPIRLAVTGLDQETPLAVSATLSRDEAPRLTVGVKIAPGWHLYGSDTGAGQPVQIEVLAGSAFAAAGKLTASVDAKGEITGAADLVLPLRRVAEGDALRATFRFMTCDALQCLPPMELQIETPPTVLLVALADDERSARIAAFLLQRGFRPDVTTYAKVGAAECDAHDLVIADSPTFGQTKGARADVRKFPQTRTPMVAVGFLGTQVLVAQKVTMACGYI